MMYYKVLAYLEANSKTKSEFDNNILLQNDGSGDYKTNYGNWQDQLDKLYHDIDDEKLDKNGSWYKHIKAVKDANAKE